MTRLKLHELRNWLAVAVATVEAFADGKLEPTPERLAAVLEALNAIDLLIGELRPVSADGEPTG